MGKRNHWSKFVPYVGAGVGSVGAANDYYQRGSGTSKKTVAERKKVGRGTSPRLSGFISSKSRGNQTDKRKTKLDLTLRQAYQNNVHDITQTYFKHENHSKLAEYIRITPPAYWEVINQTVPIGGQGIQHIYVTPHVIMDLNQYQALNGTISATANNRFFLEYASSKIEINNFSAEANEVWIYDLVARVNNGPGGSDPVGSVQAGLDEKYALTTVAPVLIPFMRPTESEVFNMYWKIENQVKVTIRPGEVHKHTKFVQYNRILDTSLFDPGLGGTFGSITAVRGVTRHTMVIACGSCVPVTGLATATISKVKHAVIQSCAYKYRTPQGLTANTVKGTIVGALDNSTSIVQMVPEIGSVQSG